MSEHDEQWLREGLASAVPEPPTNPDRARAAERLARRRRRTTATAVIGTAGAVAAAAVLTVTLTSGDNGDKTSIATDPPDAVECPAIEIRGGVAEGTTLDEPDSDAPDAVPEGATSARLCQGPGTTFEVPRHALVDGVDDLVAAVNDLEVIGPPEICTHELGPGFRIAFGYDDGSTFVVSGRLYGCQTLVVGSTYRADPAAARAAFEDLLGPDRAAGLQCPGNRTPTGSVEALPDITSAILCAGPDDLDPAPVPEAELRALVNDMVNNLGSGSVLHCLDQSIIVAETSDREQMVLPGTCHAYAIDDDTSWHPSKQAWRLLRRLAEESLSRFTSYGARVDVSGARPAP